MDKSKKEEALDVLYPPQEHDGALTSELIQEAIEGLLDTEKELQSDTADTSGDQPKDSASIPSTPLTGVESGGPEASDPKPSAGGVSDTGDSIKDSDSIDPNLEAFKTEAPKPLAVPVVPSIAISTSEPERYITAEEFVAGLEQDLGESFDKPISEPSTESAIGMKSSKITTPEEIEENNFLTLLITVQKELNQERLDVEKTNHRGSRIGGTFHRFEQELSFFVTFLQRERLYGQN